MSLTEAQVAIIKSTVPLLESGGVALTSHFYDIMFSEESSVKRFFNHSHQGEEKSQPKALAYSVLCVARNIDQIGAMLASDDGKLLINTIVKKHIAAQVPAEGYPIVGKFLLRAIREVLGPEIATDEVIEAWAVTYGIVADLFIGLEKAEYEEILKQEGGWQGPREFVVVKREFANDEKTAITYTVQSKDKKPVLKALAGQYISLRIEDKDDETHINTTRNYSCSDYNLVDENGVANMYQFTTQILDKGLVTNYLQRVKQVGSALDLHVPTGEFTLRENVTTNADSKPLVFIAGGSGITPFISMAKEARALNKDRKITLVHVSHDKEKQLLAAQTAALRDNHNIEVDYHYSGSTFHDANGPTAAFDEFVKKYMTAEGVESSNVYVVAPRGFMLNMYKLCKKEGMEAKFKTEFFGPAAFLDIELIQKA